MENSRKTATFVPSCIFWKHATDFKLRKAQFRCILEERGRVPLIRKYYVQWQNISNPQFHSRWPPFLARDGGGRQAAPFWQLNPTLMTAVRANAFCHAISPLRLSVSDGSELSSGCPRFFTTIWRSATFWPMEINYISSLYDACRSQKCMLDPS